MGEERKEGGEKEKEKEKVFLKNTWQMFLMWYNNLVKQRQKHKKNKERELSTKQINSKKLKREKNEKN